MKRFSATVRQLSLVAAAALVGVSGAVAQSYYDDDIYYDASKAPKKEVKKQQRQQPQQQTLYYFDGADYVPWTQAGIYPAASEYQPSGSSTRDVDEYNRRGSYAPSEQPDSISLAEFEQLSSMSNTERLARFHDSQAAQKAAPSIAYDEDGNAYYTDGTPYTGGNGGTTTIVSVPASSVSFNFGIGYPYYNSWYGGWPYYSYYWPYNSWYWNDWYGPGWGASWGWGPSWSWSWGPGWGYPCYPHHHWGWGGGRYYNDPPGAIRPNRPIGGGSNGNRYYGSYGSGNRGSIYNSNGRRPAASAAGTTSRPATSTRPGYAAPVTRPTTGTTPAGSYSGGRGRASSTFQYNGSSTNRQSTPAYNNSGNHRPSSTPSYSGSRGGHSSGSYSGSRGGYSGGGGGRSHGGGGYSGSRGRR